ncbi:MAG: NusA N-terminal domain-containing protein, partial [Candidatus Paceibacteria bacterium]
MALDLKTIGSAISQIAEEKGISKERVVETIEMALAAAYKKEYAKKNEIIR